MKVLAFAVSMLFHPLLLPLYVLFITFNTGTVFTYIPAYTQNMSYLLTLLGVTLIPLLCLPLLKWLGLIEGYRLVQKQDRVFPVLVTIVGAFIVFYFSRNLPYSNIVRQFYLIMVIMLYDRDDSLEDQYAHDGYRGFVWLRFYSGNEVFGGCD